MLLIEDDSEGYTRRHYGTAFFVRPNILLTAGHCTLGLADPRVRLFISRPLESGPIDLMNFVARRIETIECSVIDSLYRPDGPGHMDISILHSGTYNSPTFLQLSTLPVPCHDVVDIIGYPGRHSTDFIVAHAGLTKPFQECITSAETLLPAQTLTVTRGIVETVGSTISYKATTCPGMSGGCLLYKGNVFGFDPLIASNNVGVHVGQVEKKVDSLPASVSFMEHEIQEFLRGRGLNFV